ncbi:MAG: hypothetical protein ACXIUM_03170 [Wenzhouxiangella sp.]
MSAVLKLTLALLRTCMPSYLWLLFLFSFLVGGLALEVTGGESTAISSFALWVIACALGINLKRLRTQQLSKLLPHFQRNSLLAAILLILAIITLLATADSWRAERVIGLFAAAALGLGVGLSLSILWVSLVFMALFLWQTWPEAEHPALWSSSWTAAIAVVWLVVGLLLFVNAKSRRALKRKDRPQFQKNIRVLSLWSHNPYQFGRMMNPHPMAIWYLTAGLILGFWTQGLALFNHGLSSMVHAGNVSTISGFVAMFAVFGVQNFLLHGSDLSKSKRLRQLAILPNWSRLRLFQHVEASLWRAMTVFLLAVTIVLLGLGLWAGVIELGRWLIALLVMAAFASINLYIALCLSGKQGRILPAILLTPFTIAAAVMVQFPYWIDESNRGVALALLVPALAITILLSWWLRVHALADWSSISFRRHT